MSEHLIVPPPEQKNFPKLPGHWYLHDESQFSPKLVEKVVEFFLTYPKVLNAYLFVDRQTVVLERKGLSEVAATSEGIKSFSDEVSSGYVQKEIEITSKNFEKLSVPNLIQRLQSIITPDDFAEIVARHSDLMNHRSESIIKRFLEIDGEKVLNAYKLAEFLQANLDPLTWSLVKEFTNISKDWKEQVKKKPSFITLQSIDELNEKLIEQIAEIFNTTHPSHILIRVNKHTISVQADGSISGIAKHPAKKGEKRHKGSPLFRESVRKEFGIPLRRSFELSKLSDEMKGISIAEILNLYGVELTLPNLVDLIFLYTSKGKAQALKEEIFGKSKSHPQLLIDFIDATNRIPFDKKVFLEFMYHHSDKNSREKIRNYIWNRESLKNSIDTEEIESFTRFINEFQVKSILNSLNFLITQDEFQQLLSLFGSKIPVPDDLLREATHRHYNTVMKNSDRITVNSNIFDMESIVQNPLDFIQLLFSFSKKTQSFLLLFFRNQRKLEEQPTELFPPIRLKHDIE